MASNRLRRALENKDNFTLTENLAVTHKTTKSSLLDFFALGGALRSRQPREVENLFSAAFAENPLLAVKCMFYLRDVRGGQGERKTFRTCFHWLGQTMPDRITPLFSCVPEYGRWDDLYSVAHTPSENNMWAFVAKQIGADVTNLKTRKPISLVGKWLPSENASSKQRRNLSHTLSRLLHLPTYEYRQLCKKLRNRIKIVETKMCTDKWSKIDYEAVPSRASLIYRKAFGRHDHERYEEYLLSVKKGEKKIHAATLYPYDIVREIIIHEQFQEDATAEALWAALPNYAATDDNALVMCDTSGSMYNSVSKPEPILVALSLALYFAERNKGQFANMFLTFSAAPELQQIKGATLATRLRSLASAHWDGNTNIQAAFNLVLNTAIRAGATEKDMPKTIFIVSDMEFDMANAGGYGQFTPLTNFDTIRVKYAAAGYKLPQLVFWNVQSRHDQQPVTANDKGVILVSGCSPSTFKFVMENKSPDPYSMMLEVLNSPRYEPIKF